ncbi:MAG: ATP-binding cassette domain-containing protein [Lachnospiraceae bacterium]|nr:ATP-binding cassette domain-containing protein [Lachnospiraceae bacterium]
MNEVIEMNAVEKSYGSVPVIQNCSFRISEGEIYGLLGVNGAGKTTLMKLILGLQRADRGSIHVLGQEAGACTGYLGEVGSVIEHPAFYEHLNAEQILSMHLMYMQKEGNIPETLRLVGLEQAGQKPVFQYSLGMKQRLGLARAIVHRPRLLVLDEPLNGLDPVAVSEMCALLNRLAHDGVSILLSSHITGELRHTAHRIGILFGGCIRQEFSVAEAVSEYGAHFEDHIICLMKGASA